MRLVKAALFVGLLVGLGFMWVNRGPVIAAYRDDPATAAVRLDGIDLAYRLVEVDASPYRLPSAPDTRHLGPGLPSLLEDPATGDRSKTAPILGGTSVLQGTVKGPEGPVAGAKISIDRLTEDGIGTVDAVADDNGQWRVDGVLGGRFRARAWLPNLLTMPASVVRLVASGETAVFDFTLAPADPGPTLELVHGGLVYDGLASEVAVVASTYYVDDLGLVVARPLPDVPIALASTGDVVTWPAEAVTGADGSVRLNVQCRFVAPPTEGENTAPGSADPGAQAGAGSEPRPSGTLTATTDFQVASFALPGCLPMPEVVPEALPDVLPEVAPEGPSKVSTEGNTADG